MSDFDFDEIDKAVNSALSGTPSAPAAPTTPPSPAQAKPDPTPVRELSISSVPTPPVAAPAAKRSTGQFMDIAHPSFAVRNQAPEEEVKPEPVIQRPFPVQTAPIMNDVQPTFTPEPLESPFISDAKVEKRPLGGEAPTAVQPEPLELLEAPDEPRIEAHAMPDPIDFATRDEPLVVLEPAVEQKPEEPVVSTPLRAEAPLSIAQQYQEKTSEVQQTGAIFDTETYHQPLAHPTKKRVGFWTPFWIILLVLLGGGAGAAVYFFIMPTL